MALGLSSLGGAESAVSASVQIVRDVVHRLAGSTTSHAKDTLPHACRPPVGLAEGRALLRRGAEKTGEAIRETGKDIRDAVTDRDRDGDKDGK